MHPNEGVVPGVLNTIAAVSTITQTNEVLQVVQIAITCIAAAVSLAYTLWKWYKKAKEDGKIDKKEQEECIDIILDYLYLDILFLSMRFNVVPVS